MPREVTVNVKLDEKRLQELFDELRADVEDRIKELVARIEAVRDYVKTLPCTNCEHVHDSNTRCGATPTAVDRPCWCDWGTPEFAQEVMELLQDKEKK